jgi:uncharacterized protein (DUF305 family)
LAFIDLISKHHEQGINMAKRASDQLFNIKLKAFAQNVILNQDRELGELEQLKKVEKSNASASQ